LQEELGRVLCRHLAEDRILALAEPGRTTIGELVGRIGAILQEIRHDMDLVATRLRAPAPRPAREGAIRFPLPKNARWDEIRIRFVDYAEVEIEFRDRRARYSYAMMGFTDRRQHRPTDQWDLLERLGRGGGEFAWGGSIARGKLEKKVSRLSKALKAFFAMDDAPIDLDSKARRWVTRFRISADD
jgi:hypothetical protein